MTNKRTSLTVGLIIAALVVILAIIYFMVNTSKVASASVPIPNCNQTTCLTSLYVSSTSTASSFASIGGVYASTGVTQGGINATTTPASITISGNDFENVSLFDVTPGNGSITLTLPASSTLNTWLPSPGDSTSFILHNATTSAFTLTVAGGTGTTLEKASTTAALLSGGTATFDVFRKPNSDFIFIMNPAI